VRVFKAPLINLPNALAPVAPAMDETCCLHHAQVFGNRLTGLLEPAVNWMMDIGPLSQRRRLAVSGSPYPRLRKVVPSPSAVPSLSGYAA
jgi:hypothetical protein